MTALTPVGPMTTTDRIASTLGWTAGQVWTVALGLLLALPAGILGLGPTLSDVVAAPVPVAAPAPVGTEPTTPQTEPAGPAAPAPAPLPSILGDGAPVPAGGPSGPVAAVDGSTPAGTDPLTETVPPVESITIPGPGEVTAIAAAADGIAVAVDRGTGAPGAVVVVDRSGAVAASVDLVVDGTAHHGARGVAVTDGGVVVSTVSPPAVLRVDPVAGDVIEVATIPDLPTCIPVAAEDGCQPGLVDAAAEPAHVAVDAAGVVHVADRAQACVFRVVGDDATPWLCDVAYTPSPAIEGSGLRGLDAGDGTIVLSARTTLDGRDVVEEIAVRDGTVGPRRRLLELEPTDEIGGVTVLDDGRVATVLSATGVLVLITPGETDSSRRVPGFQRPVDVASGNGVTVAEGSADAAGALSPCTECR